MGKVKGVWDLRLRSRGPWTTPSVNLVHLLHPSRYVSPRRKRRSHCKFVTPWVTGQSYLCTTSGEETPGKGSKEKDGTQTSRFLIILLHEKIPLLWESRTARRIESSRRTLERVWTPFSITLRPVKDGPDTDPVRLLRFKPTRTFPPLLLPVNTPERQIPHLNSL